MSGSRLRSGMLSGVSDDLASWLLEQIAEDERDAQKAVGSEEHQRFIASRALRILAEVATKRRILELHRPTESMYSDGELLYPAASKLCRVCGPGDSWQAEQEGFGELPCETLRALALPYVDRPGYREEWRPRPGRYI